MKTLVEQLSNYADYHRDKRNLLTHFIGVPIIVLAVMILLSRPEWDLGWLDFSPAIAVSLAALIYYLRLDLGYGLAMTVIFTLGLMLADHLAEQSTTSWLIAGIGLFVIGWIIQFIGHYYEGRKPAFVDDLIGLLIGPLFVLAEAGFLLGLRKEVEREVIHNVGPTRYREMESLR